MKKIFLISLFLLAISAYTESHATGCDGYSRPCGPYAVGPSGSGGLLGAGW